MAKNGALAPGEKTPKQIFVTGGVVSSLGKGLTASSLGMLLRKRGLSVVMQKLDPYINVDPGVMDPMQHGEVFVTDDGHACDLDIGHYERFLDVALSGAANATTGQVYSSVLAKERSGHYQGETVQVIPHITNEIMDRMRAQATPSDGSAAPDVIITEIGGTVGDIESTPFLEAARQVRRELGRENCLFLHVSLVPYLKSAGELKTKPTQHSVATLRSLGIQPDALVLRTETEVPQSVERKVSLMCDVDLEGVVVCPDADSLYEVPKILHEQGLDTFVADRLGLEVEDVDWSAWDQLLDRVHHPSAEVEVALVGKYVGLPDAYLSTIEALRAGGFANDARVAIRWVDAASCNSPQATAKALEGVDALVVPAGFGAEGFDGKLEALRFARQNKLPTLGIALGLQAMAIEAARNVAGIPDAASVEFNPDAAEPVIWAGPDATDETPPMRIGANPAALVPGSKVADVYGATEISERHRHRYELNPAYQEALGEAGLVVSGTSPDGSLIEFMELDDDQHPFYIGTQAHPEFKSRPTNPHPLFSALIEHAIAGK